MSDKAKKIKELNIRSKAEILKAKRELEENIKSANQKIEEAKQNKKDLLQKILNEEISNRKKFKEQRIKAEKDIESKRKLIDEERKIIDQENLLSNKNLLLKTKENEKSIILMKSKQKNKLIQIKEKVHQELIEFKKTQAELIKKTRAEILRRKIEIQNQRINNEKKIALKRAKIKEEYQKIAEEQVALEKRLKIEKENFILESRKRRQDLKQSIIEAKQDYQNIFLDIKQKRLKEKNELLYGNVQAKKNKLENLKRQDDEKLQELVDKHNSKNKIKRQAKENIDKMVFDSELDDNINEEPIKEVDISISDPNFYEPISTKERGTTVRLVGKGLIKRFDKFNKSHSKYELKKLNLFKDEKKLIADFQKAKSEGETIDIKEFVKYASFNSDIDCNIEDVEKLITSAIIALLSGKVWSLADWYFYISIKKGLRQVEVSDKLKHPIKKVISMPNNQFWKEMEKAIVIKLNHDAYIKLCENIAITKIENSLRVITDVPFMK